MQIFIVAGGTGEGPDHISWNVKAFRDKEQAVAHMEEIHQEVARLKEVLNGPTDWNDTWVVVKDNAAWLYHHKEKKVETKLGVLDPHFVCDYTGVWYTIQEIELVDATD